MSTHRVLCSSSSYSRCLAESPSSVASHARSFPSSSVTRAAAGESASWSCRGVEEEEAEAAEAEAEEEVVAFASAFAFATATSLSPAEASATSSRSLRSFSLSLPASSLDASSAERFAATSARSLAASAAWSSAPLSSSVEGLEEEEAEGDAPPSFGPLSKAPAPPPPPPPRAAAREAMSEVRSRLTRASSSACRVFGRCDFIFEFRESNEEARKEPQGAPLFFRSLPLSLPLPLSLLPLAPPQFSPHRTRSDGPWPVASPAATASEEQRKQKRFSFLFLLLLLLYSILLQRCRSPRAAPRAPAPPQAGRGACAGAGARRERGTWRLRPSMLLRAVMARLPRGSAGGRGRRRVLDKNRKRRKMSFFSSFSGRKSFLRQLSWCSLVQKKPIQSFDASRHRHCLSLFLRYFGIRRLSFKRDNLKADERNRGLRRLF